MGNKTLIIDPPPLVNGKNIVAEIPGPAINPFEIDHKATTRHFLVLGSSAKGKKMVKDTHE